jgi:hypothetical protein
MPSEAGPFWLRKRVVFRPQDRRGTAIFCSGTRSASEAATAVDGSGVDNSVTAAVYRGALFRAQADLLRDALRGAVVRMDDRDQPGRAEHSSGEVERSGRR